MVSLIITAYHADMDMVRLTEACLASLKNGRPDEVIVVDDGSPILVGLTGVNYYLRREFNGGFPKCANTGWAEANGDVLILSNNDVEFTPGWLEAILKPINEGYDISSILVSDGDGTTTKDEIEEDGYFGSLWAQKRYVFERLGGFDESFDKGTFEDKDYFVRAKRAGFRIAKYHGAYVNHIGRATMDKLYPNQEDFKEGMEKFRLKHGAVL